MDTHLARAFCNGIYAWQHTRCHLRSCRTLCNPWKHWAPLTGQQNPSPHPTPKPPLPGVPSSYLLNLLCPPWYGFRRPLSFGLHSGFFNYVVHFTCLCSFTPQDQGQERSHLIISKQEASTRPHISYVMLPYLLLQQIRQNKHYSICLKKETMSIPALPPVTTLLVSIRKFVYLSGG